MNLTRVALSLLCLAALAALVIACLPSEPTHVVTQGDFVLSYKLKERQRVDRVTFDFVFDATLTTTGQSHTGVKAIVSSSNAQTQVLDPFLMFPGATPSATTPSFDTFTIRQDRQSAFNPADLAWTLEPLQLPPDPGGAGRATLEGIDSNGDGVRDDIERFIEFTYPADQEVMLRAALRKNARSLGKALRDAGGTREVSVANSNENVLNIGCVHNVLYAIGRGEEANDVAVGLEAEFLNTLTRLRAYARYQDDIVGSVGPAISADSTSACVGSN